MHEDEVFYFFYKDHLKRLKLFSHNFTKFDEN